jgi:hypothetical protein
MQLLLRFGNAQARLHAELPRIVIGGDPAACQLVFQDGSVGAAHAEVYVDNGQPFLRDLGSGCGTWIDGVPASDAPVMLRPGVTVVLGRVPLVLQQEGDTFREAAYGQPMQPGYPPPPPPSGYGPQHVMTPLPMKAIPQPMPGYGAPEGQPHGYRQPIGQPMPQPIEVRPVPQPKVPTTDRPPPMPPLTPAQPMPAYPLPLPAPQVPLVARAPEHLVAKPSAGSYRRQASNYQGVLLIALPGDSFAHSSNVDGFVELTVTALDTIPSIWVELVEHPSEGGKGTVRERMLLHQGPWSAPKNHTVTMPFSLRTPASVASSGAHVRWEVRCYLEAGVDLACSCPIALRP